MSLEPRFVDLTLRGLRVAEKARLELESPTVGFVAHDAPLPIGTRLLVAGDDDFRVEARVVKVVEQEAGAASPPGMKLDWSVITVATPPPPVAAELAAAEEELAAAGDDVSGSESTPPAETPPSADGKRKRNRRKTSIGR
jgi:hypothetical protein